MSSKKVKRNDPCPCGSGKKYKRCCEEKTARQIREELARETMTYYKERSQWFQDILDERSEGEVAYDNVILEQVEHGKTLEEALKIAGQKYPDEALDVNEKTREDIFNHYEYFINHEQLKKIERKISDKF